MEVKILTSIFVEVEMTLLKRIGILMAIAKILKKGECGLIVTPKNEPININGVIYDGEKGVFIVLTGKPVTIT